MNKISALVLLLIILLAGCLRTPPDIGNSHWGDSMEQVYFNEGGQWQRRTDTCQFAGLETITYFTFDEDSLYAGYYMLAGSDSSNMGKSSVQ